MAWMGCWDIHLCHVSSSLLWTPTFMVESHFDMGLHHLNWIASSSTPMVWQKDKDKSYKKNNLLLLFFFLALTKNSFTSAVHTLLPFDCRLRNSVPWPGQRWKPWSPWRLPLSNRGGRSPGRASGKSHRPSVLHAELLFHLLTLINCHSFPSCFTFHLRDAANGVCPSTCLWDHSPWNTLQPNTLTSFYHRLTSIRHS